MVDVKTRADDVQVAPDSPAPAAKPTAPTPEMPPTAVAFAGKAKDLAALCDTVVDAANVGAGLWFSYLFVLLYLIVAVGGVTHRNLLLESPVKLPFLGVELPLVGFFVLGPALFLIVHAYVLLHFAMLADKVGVFHAELQAQIADENMRARLRRQLPSNIFVQFLAGPVEVRSGLMGTLLRLIAQISLVVGPLALLVFFQFQFLPYHDEAISWWQRIAVIADLALLWALWPSIARGETSSIGWRDLRRPHVAAVAMASLLPVLLVFTIATFPGERLNRNPILLPVIPQFKSGSVRWVTPHEFLVAGDVDLVAAKPTSLWSNRLVLPGLDLERGESLSLRGRNLEGAVLFGANLRKVDFTATRLRAAVLNEADLREAKFLCTGSTLTVAAYESGARPDTTGEQCAQLRDALLVGAQLEGATFKDADMEGATFDKAQLPEADFEHAKLRGASFWRARLPGARLLEADLRGAVLDEAWLQGASLDGAQMQGASLKGAKLQGATLAAAQLQGAYLDGAELQSATLAYTAFWGASLHGANLDGAWLNHTQLLGAMIDRANFTNASLENVRVWRATGRYVMGNPRVVEPETELVHSAATAVPQRNATREDRADCVGRHACEWTAKLFADLKGVIMALPEERRDAALKQIEVLDPDATVDGEARIASQLTTLAQSPPAPAAYDNGLAEALRRTGCHKDGAPYVIRGLLRSLKRRLADGGPARALATAFLDEPNCAGAHGLSGDDKAILRQMQDGVSH